MHTQFAALLASVGKDGPVANAQQSPAARPSASSSPAPKPKPTTVTNAVKPVGTPGASTLKRKADDTDAGGKPKTVRTETTSTASQTGQPTKVPTNPGQTAATAYKGTARGPAPTNLAKPKPAQATSAKPSVGLNNVPKPATPVSTSSAAAPPPKKGGFAATLARAAAAQQAAKASAASNIVHKPVEKLSKRERERQRLAQEAAEKQKQKGGPAAKGKMAQQAGRSRSGTPGDGKAGAGQKKGPVDVGYQGTMRKQPKPLSYSGTMRAADPAKPAKPVKQKDKFGGQDRYGGYASWSDLSDAEEEDEGDYMSESDDMEGGFDDVEREEAAAARLARREDQEALEEEERLKREKLERKRKLEAMAKQAQGKKRF